MRSLATVMFALLVLGVCFSLSVKADELAEGLIADCTPANESGSMEFCTYQDLAGEVYAAGYRFDTEDGYWYRHTFKRKEED